MEQRIMELARVLGKPAAEDEAVLAVLCGAAQLELTAALREGVKAEDCGDAFALSAALMALAGLETSRCAGQAESFRAGDVTIQSGDPGKKAGLLREQATRLMAPWAKDRNFIFCGVRGL